jgi:hypothetical protein
MVSFLLIFFKWKYYNEDWRPTTRTGQLAMVNEWITVCTAKQSAWDITQPGMTNLTSVRDVAVAALEAATNKSTRTPVATARSSGRTGQTTCHPAEERRHRLRFFGLGQDGVFCGAGRERRHGGRTGPDDVGADTIGMSKGAANYANERE